MKVGSKMQIGSKIKRLRLQSGLTQEELGERTDLTKGYISQLERDLNSPSIETLFSLLEVLGTTPKDFFDETKKSDPVVYSPEHQTTYTNDDMHYKIRWLIPRSNENEMEPVHITFSFKGELKQFAPSLSETFIYVLVGNVEIEIEHKCIQQELEMLFIIQQKTNIEFTTRMMARVNCYSLQQNLTYKKGDLLCPHNR